MSDVIIRAFEGDPLPDHVQNPRVLLVEDVPWGVGTNTRRRYTLLVTDGRYWLADEAKRAEPLGETVA